MAARHAPPALAAVRVFCVQLNGFEPGESLKQKGIFRLRPLLSSLTGAEQRSDAASP